MKEWTISATRFKAHCPRLLDQVALSGEVLVVTKHNKPVARVVLVQPVKSLRGSVRFLVSDGELIAPLGEVWEANA